MAVPSHPSNRLVAGPATTCRRTDPSSSGSRSSFESVFQSRPRFHQMSQSLCAHRHLDTSTPLKHAPVTSPEHSLCCLRSSMCSGGEGDHPAPARRQGHPDDRPPRVTPRDRRARGRPPPPFRNVDSPPAAPGLRRRSRSADPASPRSCRRLGLWRKAQQVPRHPWAVPALAPSLIDCPSRTHPHCAGAPLGRTRGCVRRRDAIGK